jgi:MYXO-CTERM domain-containing protein
MPVLTKVTPVVLIALATGTAAAQSNYAFSGVSGFIQDLDANDGVDLITALQGTWSGAFEIETDSLVFVSNSQNQGGSLTRYSGVVLNNLVLQTAIGNLVVTDTAVVGTLELWDRQNFGAGQRILGIDFNINGTSVGFDLVVNASNDLYATIFNPGTPGPNTYTGLPTFDGSFGNLLSSARLSLDGDLPILPGRGRYNGSASSLTVIPAPGALGALALGGLVASRRRR